MAEKRMFAKTIIDSDAFLDMPQSSQNLYFHLSMRADDDGFVNNPKKIIRVVNSSNDDLKLLISKRFLIAFESGIIVIKHWKIHNYIAKDRYRKTKYIEELSQLTVNDNGSYTDCIQIVDNMSTQSSIGKVSIGKVSTDTKKHKYGEYKHILLSDEEYQKLEDKDLLSWITKMDEAIEMKGYKYKSHYLAILKWERDEKKPEKKTLQNITMRATVTDPDIDDLVKRTYGKNAE